MAKAPEGYVPKWMIAGKANTAVITEELLKEKSYEELPNFAKEFLEESKKEGELLGMTTPSLGNLNIEPVKTNIVVHLSELWVILRRVVRFLVIAILFVALVPGFKDDKLSISPYEPAIIQILQIIIVYAKTSLIQGVAGNESQIRLFIGSPLSVISLYINLAVFFALVLSLPYIIREVMEWIKPGLTGKEYDILKSIALLATFLFIIGALISYFVILPLTLRVLSGSGAFIGGEALDLWYDLESVINLLLWGTLGAGVLYASPVFLLVLVHLEFMNSAHIEGKRKEVMFGVFVIAAIITPDPTIVSMLVLSIPMILIVELVIQLGKRIEIKRNLLNAQEVLV